MHNKESISEFLDTRYKEFALYSIESRAIPSYIDSFKPTQRKIIHVSNQIWKNGNEKILKIFQLAGSVASDCFYHHGDSSLSSAIINMAQKFKNNAPLLEEDGQFGTLRSPHAGAPRYIGTKLSNNFRLIYKDFELLEYKEEEGEIIEPKFFLPIIPTVLINGGSGIAVGFASKILNRGIKEVIDATITYLKSGKTKSMPPHLNGFLGSYSQDPENRRRWIIRGIFERINANSVRITELPISLTYEEYEEILDKLVDTKKIISYEDNCKDNIDYTIKFTRSDLASLSDDDLIKILRIEESQTENFTTLDENGKLKIFEGVEEILSTFVDFRMEYYLKRKEFILDKLNYELKILKNKGKFIKFILDNKIIVNSKTKSEIEFQIEESGLDKIESSHEYLLRLPIHSLSKESFEKIKEDFLNKKQEVDQFQKVDPKKMYLQDLEDLKKKMK